MSELLHSRRAQAVLSLVFLIGGIIVLAGLTLAFLANSFLNSTYGFAISERAKAVAASGAYDALMRLARNKDLSTSGYSLSVGSDSATVSVTQDSPATGLVIVTSISTISNRERRVRAVVSRDATSSLIATVSWD
ncbi:MAG: hypothetical protein HY434_01830 [Candidatus Liptonbacteria bacterium]|nr:hypothetical protein [Candidatus Liptonbacteria bacterium]